MPKQHDAPSQIRTPDNRTGQEPAPWPVIGHRWAVELLRRTLAPSGPGPRHAYLFLGPPQVGKTTLARAFAQALLCSEPGPDPCGVCRSCQLMARDAHPDFRLIQPLDRNGQVDRLNGLLRVEQANQVVHETMLRPMEAAYKVFLLQDVHRANDSFANKLLKTLEEPPEHVILCLTAQHRSQLLPTILSRCQQLELRPLDTPTVEAALQQNWGASPEQARLLARLSGGRLGWAVRQLASPQAMETRTEALTELRRLARSGRIERLAAAQEMASRRTSEDLFERLALWASWWRDVMLAQSGCLDACTHVDMLDAIQEDARLFDPRQVRAYLSTLRQIEEYLHHTVNTHLALDVLFLQMPRPGGAS